jgi:hypothetical protein
LSTTQGGKEAAALHCKGNGSVWKALIQGSEIQINERNQNQKSHPDILQKLWALVVHTFDLGGRDQEAHGSKSALANSSQNLVSKITYHTDSRVAHVVECLPNKCEVLNSSPSTGLRRNCRILKKILQTSKQDEDTRSRSKLDAQQAFKVQHQSQKIIRSHSDYQSWGPGWLRGDPTASQMPPQHVERLQCCSTTARRCRRCQIIATQGQAGE